MRLILSIILRIAIYILIATVTISLAPSLQWIYFGGTIAGILMMAVANMTEDY